MEKQKQKQCDGKKKYGKRKTLREDGRKLISADFAHRKDSRFKKTDKGVVHYLLFKRTQFIRTTASEIANI